MRLQNKLPCHAVLRGGLKVVMLTVAHFFLPPHSCQSENKTLARLLAGVKGAHNKSAFILKSTLYYFEISNKGYQHLFIFCHFL
jgi:hypothetical protein